MRIQKLRFRKKIFGPVNNGHAIALFVLIICIIITSMWVFDGKSKIERNEQKAFDYQTKEYLRVIKNGLESQAHLLWNVAAFFEASDSVSKEEFKTFISHLDLKERFPGIQGIGYSMLIDSKDKQKHEHLYRTRNLASYSITPDYPRPLYTSIIYLEPSDTRNLRALGYDMYSEPVRRTAMQKACDLNEASLSGKVTLVQEIGYEKQAGTLMYVPFYNKNMPNSNAEERRKSIIGWIYSPYRMNDLLNAILLNTDLKTTDNIQLEIFDGDKLRPEAALFKTNNTSINYSTTANSLQIIKVLNFNQKLWTLKFTKALPHQSFYFYPEVIHRFIVGCIISFLILVLILALAKSKLHLKESKSLLLKLDNNLSKQIALFNAIPDSIIITDKSTGKIEDFNPKATNSYKYNPLELLSKPFQILNSLTSDFENSNSTAGIIFSKHMRSDLTEFPVEISQSEFVVDNQIKILSVIRDLSDREKIEKELFVKNIAFENSSVAQSIADNEKRIVYANDAFARLWGFENPAEVINKKIDNFFANISEYDAVLTQIINQDIWQGEFEGVRQDGNTFTTESFASIIKNNKGELIGFQATNVDITEKKHKEKLLLEYKEAINQASNGIAIIDTNRKVRFSNKAWAQMHGYEIKEILNCDVSLFHTQEQIDNEVNPHLDILLKNGKNSGEIMHKHKDGSIFYTWMNTTVLKDRQGNITGLLGVAEDINERKLSEIELQKTKEHYKTLVENANDAIVVTFIDRIAFANSKTYEILGFKENEFNIIDYRELLHPDDAQVLVNKYIQLTEGIPLQKELARIKHKEGYYLWAEFSAVVFEWDNEPAVLSFISEVTERIQAQQQIQTALHEKEVLLREIHHRVKNNLQVVSSLLNIQANNSNDKQIKDALSQSRNRIRSITLVHEKLYRSGNFTEINLKEYTSSLVAELYRVYVPENEEIGIKIDVSVQNVPLIYAIPIGLIINELVTNSLKYAFPKNVTFETSPEITIKLQQLPNQHMHLTISDNGVGLPDNYQINNSSSLGLYLVQILVNEQLDGQLHIDNQKGTIFTITFNPFSK